MTIKDIYDYVKADWCGNCQRERDNGWRCPYNFFDDVFCAVDTVKISLEYLARGEYYG